MGDCFYRDAKWEVRVTSARGRMFFYVDAPIGGDDGSFDEILPWAEIAAKYDDPLFLLGDYAGVPTSWEGRTVFKDSCPKSSPHALPFFHPVLIDKEPRSILECRYKSSFVGATYTHQCRDLIVKALRDMNALTYVWINNKTWWGFDEIEKAHLRSKYLEVMEDTQFVLCPRGKGLNSIRFFETLRLGRIPVLAANDAKLPLEDSIPYSQFIVRVAEQELDKARWYIESWLLDNDIGEASKMAREVSLEYFSDPEKFIQLSLASH